MRQPTDADQGGAQLRREVGLGGAVLLGLGSIVGTGVFVSAGIATAITGPSVVLAAALAALVATCNGLSSAQLAASHPVSGGTYEYGHRYLNATLGFSAGWLFLVAKSASAATAALGFAGYLLGALGDSAGGTATGRLVTAMAAVVVLTSIAAGGIRRSNRTNALIVAITVAALVVFVVAAAPRALGDGGGSWQPFLRAPGWDGASGLLHATALMFVAYTGYGRIATLGEEVRAPARTIPRAIIATLGVSMALYVLVTAAAIGAGGAQSYAAATAGGAAPLVVVARALELPAVALAVTIGAVTAMLGVLLNLLLGLSRVVLAMARRGDLPRLLAHVDSRRSTPWPAVLVVGAVIAALVLIGDVRTTWSFSAFTVLLYYALTNLAALRLPAADRRFPRWVAVAGLVACLGLTVWIEPAIWLSGGAVLALGLLWHRTARWVASRRATADERPD